MKSKKTLVLAGSILALTISAFPHVALAGTGAAPPQASANFTRKAGGSPLKYVTLILAARGLVSALLP